jgi:hypothetical protein
LLVPTSSSSAVPHLQCNSASSSSAASSPTSTSLSLSNTVHDPFSLIDEEEEGNHNIGVLELHQVDLLADEEGQHQQKQHPRIASSTIPLRELGQQNRKVRFHFKYRYKFVVPVAKII